MDFLQQFQLHFAALLLFWLYWRGQVDCNCDTADLPAGKAGKTPFIQTMKFLGIVTVFAGLMLAFPMYASIFFPKSENQTIVTDKSNVQTAEFTINGMTCSGCEEHIKHELNKLSGIIKTTVSYGNGKAIVVFDQTQTNFGEIEKAIEKTGYSVAHKKEIK